MQENLFHGINVPAEKIHVPCGTADDIDSEGKHYDEMIAEAGGIDVQILGIGNNGHIAFNEPCDCLLYTSVAFLHQRLVFFLKTVGNIF